MNEPYEIMTLEKPSKSAPPSMDTPLNRASTRSVDVVEKLRNSNNQQEIFDALEGGLISREQALQLRSQIRESLFERFTNICYALLSSR